ncbi:MAG: hypothetical protein RLP44_22125 [Aggregatilineales bacterium]
MRVFIVTVGICVIFAGLAILVGRRSESAILEFASNRTGTSRVYLMDSRHPRLLLIQPAERFVPSSNFLCPNINQWQGIATYQAYPYAAQYQPIFPIYSQNQTQILFESALDGNFDIYLLNTTTLQLVNLTDANGETGYQVCPIWSPDESQILFMSRINGDFDIIRLDVETGEQINLTDHEGTDSEYAWSPDGTHIVFTSFRDGDGEIFVMDADGGNLHRLTARTGSDFAPVWSPDGTHIAFSSRRSGNPEIYIMNDRGGDVRRLTTHPNSDYAPFWVK